MRPSHAPSVPLSTILLAALFGACSHSRPEPVAQPTPVAAEAQPPASTEAPPGGVERLVGTLVYEPPPAVKSFDAYDGIDFQIDGRPVEESSAVSAEALIALNGQRVEVECVMRVPPPPDSRSQYPVGPDGGPLPRTPRCAVMRVVPAP